MVMALGRKGFRSVTHLDPGGRLHASQRWNANPLRLTWAYIGKATIADQDQPASPLSPPPQTPAFCRPELFYVADGNDQGFGDDEGQQPFPITISGLDICPPAC